MSVGQRIREVRKACNLTQQAFADQLGLKQNTIATYEIEKTIPSDRTLLSICQTFHVNEGWLRTGEGQTFVTPPATTPDEQLAMFLGQITGENSFRTRLISALSRLSDEEWAVLERLANELAQPKT
ncbi:helix-turn-helix transcriptional regulator [Pseudoflavonifractor sp. An85]|uniref:helix-turn-helix domain-containing protein n=1 Tax=Pseudoflavonifractor sp. An85 TaxID=1965661 RepID=UPI000B39EB87|nr:helix-turn-helix transcriptional regulator [Pseudoflavonifractor sp. An85]OUN21608.1 hypothetical protein B5G37_10935 [Pseudoflavonifractor sp. An85]